jgi:Spy/CpxP family protein refolding chaperone
MKTGKKALLISLTMVAFSAFALAASAKSEGKEGPAGCECKAGKMGGMEMHEMHMAKELDLTTEQTDKLRANKLAGEKERIQAEADMKKLHVDLKTEVMKDNPDMAAIEGLTKKMGEMHGNEMLAMIKDKIFFRSLLTPAQKKKMGQMMDMEMAEHHEGMEKHEKMEKHEGHEK